MKIVLFNLLLTGFFLLFHKMEALEHVASVLKKTREDMDAASRQRSLADRQRLLMLQEKHSFWYSLEQLLQYSGIKRRFPGVTAEWWLVWNVAAGAAVFLIFGAVWDIRTALAAVSVFGLAEWYCQKKLRERNLRRTELA